MQASSSKISLGGLENNKSREQLGGMGNMNLSATGPLNQHCSFNSVNQNAHPNQLNLNFYGSSTSPQNQ